MRRLLLPPLAAPALPTAVNAEVANYYLVANLRRSIFVIPMQTLEFCEGAGKKYKTSKAWNPRLKNPYQLSYISSKAK
tara:strand:- start:264 stop:497 length:234 start_codon:yes stop_codon:yes gene_type:complete